MKTPATLPPALETPVPGPRSRELAARLARVESRNVTCLEPEAPIFWERARASNVWDADGNRFVDLSGAFGVANAGHGHPHVVAAVQRQAEDLLHGMGDVHPPRVKVELLEALVARFPGGVPATAILGSTGSDAVEAAQKTALLATGRAGIVAFEGGYHGLSFGSLDSTWRSDFRTPFEAGLSGRTSFARYGDLQDVERVAQESTQPIGMLLVEPVQGRGGERVPPRGFLSGLRELCDREGWLLAADEIYTGFGRTGRWFACEHEQVIPDLLCVGKGLASGLPISACLGRREVMESWPASRGEALHTQTFLGHPLGCAAGLASMQVIADERLVERAASLGAQALDELKRRLAGNPRVREVRGLGLMIGVECTEAEVALRACRRALERGIVLLPSGDQSRVVSATPPLSICEARLFAALEVLSECLA